MSLTNDPTNFGDTQKLNQGSALIYREQPNCRSFWTRPRIVFCRNGYIITFLTITIVIVALKATLAQLYNLLKMYSLNLLLGRNLKIWEEQNWSELLLRLPNVFKVIITTLPVVDNKFILTLKASYASHVLMGVLRLLDSKYENICLSKLQNKIYI